MSDAPAPTTEPVPPTVNGTETQEKVVVEEAPGFKVFVGNLAYATVDDGLKAFFAPVESDILTAQVIMRGTRSAGYGFVALKTAEAAQKAVELLDKKELDGRQIIVEVAKPAEQKDQERKEKKARKRIGRRGTKAIPGEVTDAEAAGEGAKAEGEAAAETGDAAKPKKKKKKATKKPKAAAANGDASAAEGVTTEGEAAAPKAPKKKRTPRPPRPAGEAPVGEPSKTVLFVANLGFNIDDAGLSALFTDAGIKVNSARIVRRRWGKPRKSKGYGFVDVGDEAEQKKAIEALEGKDVGGRPIAVKIAVNTQEIEEEEKKEAEGAAPVAEEVVVAA